MEITACPVCGSTNIGIGTLGDGIISGLSSWNEVCRNCGYQGPSLIFENEEAYQKFLTALKERKGTGTAASEAPQPNEEPDEMTQEDKEVAALLKETKDTPQPPKKSNYRFEFVLALILSILFFTILIGGSYLGINSFLFSHSDFTTILLYLFGSFIGVLIFFFLLLAFIETLYRSIRFRGKN
jgi:transcription elongation factor Elf1